MRKRKRVNRWLVIIGAVLAAHFLLFLLIKPSAIQLVRRAVAPAGENAAGGNPPDAVISIPIEYENGSAEQTPVPVVSIDDEKDRTTPISPTDAPPASSGPPGPGGMEGLIGDASQTVPRGADPDLVRIPPRPLQITWPDTRRLKHCMGHQIAVRVQVDETGRILRVEPPDEDHPPDCVAAALESDARIVFAPGTIGGRAVKMWTEIRVDFRAKD